MRKRKAIGGYVEVQVEIDDVLSEIDDDDLKEEFANRFGEVADYPLIDEVAELIERHQYNAALALIYSAQNARRVTDYERRQQYNRVMGIIQ